MNGQNGQGGVVAEASGNGCENDIVDELYGIEVGTFCFGFQAVRDDQVSICRNYCSTEDGNNDGRLMDGGKLTPSADKLELSYGQATQRQALWLYEFQNVECDQSTYEAIP